MNDYYQQVKNYFNAKADDYDDVDKQLYWVLSDNFFKKILEKEIPRVFDGGSLKLLDAGAGTGRWTLFLCELFGRQFDITGELVDISENMLAVARKKFEEKGLAAKFSFVLGNIENMPEISDNSYDLSLSFYNVISFVEKPAVALAEIYRKLKSGSAHISILANKYHAYYFSILTNRLSELDEIKNKSKIRFNESMPSIRCFTPQEAEELYRRAGFKNIKIIGGPNFIYPGMEETSVHGYTDNIQNKLENKDVYTKILEIEMDNYNNNQITGRGNALLVIAQK